MKGIKLTVGPHLSHSHISGHYELDTLVALQQLVQPGSICYDLGASIGYMSLLMARDAGQVYAFEPAPHAAEVIRQNVAVNGFSNIIIVPVPVSDTVRPVQFALTDVAYGSNISTGESKWNKIQLVTTTLDEFIRDHPLPDVLKIDVEDEEGRVLQGATQLLRARKTRICCELHSLESVHTVTDLLLANDYRITTLDGKPFVVPQEVVPGELQIVAMPPSVN